MQYNSGDDEDYIVLVQVDTVPVTIATGQANSLELATDKAAKNVLCMFRAMLLLTSSST